MSTPAVVKFADKDGIQCAYYVQCDGYPTGHGKALIEFLLPYTVVDGYGSRSDQHVANGAGCLAAQAVKHFKDGIGVIYMCHPDTEESYTYVVKAIADEPIHLTVVDGDVILYDGALPSESKLFKPQAQLTKD